MVAPLIIAAAMSAAPAIMRMFKGSDTSAEDLQERMYKYLQSIPEPTLAQLSIPQLQQYVLKGVLTPQQYSAVQANPQIYSQIMQQTQDLSGQQAQKSALQQLGGIVQAGGSTPINQANLINNINQTNQAMQAARAGISENAQERGVAGGGQEFLNKLLNEQGNAQIANTGAVNAAANNAQLALQAITQGGQLGGQLQGQANQSAQAQAEAGRQIAEYNSQLQSTANQYNAQTANAAQATNLGAAQTLANQNTGLANERTMYNAQLPQQIYQNAIQKAGPMQTATTNQSNIATNRAEQQAQAEGGLAGLAGNLYGQYAAGQTPQASAPRYGGSYGPPPGANTEQYDPNRGYAHGGEVGCYAEGGEVHDHSLCMKAGGPVPGQAEQPGDNTANDTIPATLSPHEIVLPRSVAMAPNAPSAAAQFVGGIKGQPAPSNFSDVITMLEANGLELRLGSKI